MFQYGQDQLTISSVYEIATERKKAILTDEVKARVEKSRSQVEKMASGAKPVYGINTGFGPLCDTQISPEQTKKLQENLLITHAVGVGKPIEPIFSKIMMICKVHALCQGYSGVRLKLIERIIYFIENNLLPVVPAQGSVGASGDLAPLAHLFLPLIGHGYFWQNNKKTAAIEVLRAHDLKPLVLESKEGLGLINGTQFILAHAIAGLHKMAYLLDLADVSGTMSLEGFQGSAAPFKASLHTTRPFRGNQMVAKHIRKLLKDSQNLQNHFNCSRVQDPYSIRCMPQVHGASRNAFFHLMELTEIEMNSVTDNPIIISETEAVSGGNFHGQPLALALDYCTLAAAELGNIADRRCYLLLEGKYGLPRLLTKGGGLNSGLMIPQYTAAALVSENKSLCFPASADSIPTSLGQEDHVSMGSISGRKFNQVLDNVEKILAIELLYACQALDFRRPNTFSEIIEQNHAKIRSKVEHLEDDRILKNDIDVLIKMVQNREVIVS
ncbi:MAG: histidine ammonia-lyase [Flavobacteriales bacterium]|nr:MAG: histidine ammonia-lyase [Flavobacteriales bacterium]